MISISKSFPFTLMDINIEKVIVNHFEKLLYDDFNNSWLCDEKRTGYFWCGAQKIKNMNLNIFKNKRILVTGGTGSFGQKFTEIILKKTEIKSLIIYSRDEMKQYFMSQKFNNTKVKFLTGDVRDKERLHSSMDSVDYVVHAAATKIVPAAEFNPTECVKTNIIGAMNVIEACKNNNIKGSSLYQLTKRVIQLISMVLPNWLLINYLLLVTILIQIIDVNFLLLDMVMLWDHEDQLFLFLELKNNKKNILSLIKK